KYQRAISKRQRYQTLSLPLGFCYRTSDDTCILLCNAIKSTKKEYFFKNEELKKLQKLLQEDPLVIEALGIKNEFFYRVQSTEEQLDTLMLTLNIAISQTLLQSFIQM